MKSTATVKRKKKVAKSGNGHTTTERFLSKDLEPKKPPRKIVTLVSKIVEAKELARILSVFQF